MVKLGVRVEVVDSEPWFSRLVDLETGTALGVPESWLFCSQTYAWVRQSPWRKK